MSPVQSPPEKSPVPMCPLVGVPVPQARAREQQRSPRLAPAPGRGGRWSRLAVIGFGSSGAHRGQRRAGGVGRAGQVDLAATSQYNQQVVGPGQGGG